MNLTPIKEGGEDDGEENELHKKKSSEKND